MAGTLSDGFLWQGAVTTGELIILPHSCLTSLHSSDYTEGERWRGEAGGGGGGGEEGEGSWEDGGG